jgi:hypothetical protein
MCYNDGDPVVHNHNGCTGKLMIMNFKFRMHTNITIYWRYTWQFSTQKHYSIKKSYLFRGTRQYTIHPTLIQNKTNSIIGFDPTIQMLSISGNKAFNSYDFRNLY